MSAASSFLHADVLRRHFDELIVGDELDRLLQPTLLFFFGDIHVHVARARILAEE